MYDKNIKFIINSCKMSVDLISMVVAVKFFPALFIYLNGIICC